MKAKQSLQRPFVKSSRRKAEDQPKEGAWKLAYADFVTAMMCFFMLMWLLNATPSQKLKSMAMYFKPTVGFFNKNDNKVSDEISINTPSVERNSDTTTDSQSDVLQSIEAKIISDLSSDGSSKDLVNNISTKISGDGLEISVFDNNKTPMFKKSSTELTDDAKLLMTKITKIITYLPNRVVIGGHTEKTNGVSIDGYSGWELAAGRASSAMKVMQLNGLPEEKIAKLVSYGDNSPIDENDPYNRRNRRITITLLAKWSTVDYKAPISKSALSLD
jgi:chemotaxis protein MotB